MKNMPKRIYSRKVTTTNNKMQLTTEPCISKEKGQLHHTIWRPREMKVIAAEA